MKVSEMTEAAKRKMHKRLRTIILIALLVVALLVSGLFVYLYVQADKTGKDSGFHYASATDPDEEETGLVVGYDNVDASSLDEYLTKWATNGIKPLQDKNVVNIMLCGIDARSGDATGGRSDSMILVSINKKAKKITMTSFFRDSYTYIDLTSDPNSPRTMMEKINAAYSLGGPATLMQTLEANYKITVDDYVSVDFITFPKLIDALGGVRVDVTQDEASYINRTAPTMRGRFPAGKNVLLTGQQALVFSRVRHLDSDVERTARQRRVIMGILTAAKNASAGQINNAVKLTMPYLTTNLSNWEITALTTNAISGGWLDYPVTQLHSPTVEIDGATGFSTYIRTRFVWVVDYPKAAHDLQMALYGVSNIELITEGAARDDYLYHLFLEAKHGSSAGSSSGSSGAGGGSASGLTTAAPPPSETQIPPETSLPAETTTGGGLLPWLTWPVPSTAPPEPSEPPPEPPTVIYSLVEQN
ncbi:MAG: LCP family protein [Oscillospiraceae bacterium]|jgi:LCP family protein required for cell wall assembly|nr:LCP family protein [Oscillospiraceae bacterium]